MPSNAVRKLIEAVTGKKDTPKKPTKKTTGKNRPAKKKSTAKKTTKTTKKRPKKARKATKKKTTKTRTKKTTKTTKKRPQHARKKTVNKRKKPAKKTTKKSGKPRKTTRKKTTKKTTKTAKKRPKKARKATKKKTTKTRKKPAKKTVTKQHTARKKTKKKQGTAKTQKKTTKKRAPKKPTKKAAKTQKKTTNDTQEKAHAQEKKKVAIKTPTAKNTIIKSPKSNTKTSPKKAFIPPLLPPPPVKKRPKTRKIGALEQLTMTDPRKQSWYPERSKIKAAIELGLPASYLHVRRMLYIGAGHGYTISHIHTKPLELYALEKSGEMMQHFLPLAEDLPTVLPIYGDAAMPDSYAQHIPEKVDVVFQDIAQKDQVGIFLGNCERFLSQQGVGILILKASAVDSTAEPAAVYAEARQRLEEGGATIIQEISLEPYQKHHRLYVIHLTPLMDW